MRSRSSIIPITRSCAALLGSAMLVSSVTLLPGCGSKGGSRSGGDSSSTSGAAGSESTTGPVLADSLVVGAWHAQLVAADAAGRRVELALRSDHAATLTSDYMNGRPPTVESGPWLAREGDIVRVTLDHRGGESVSRTDLFFRLDGTRLTMVDPDAQVWGAEGLALDRGPAPVSASTVPKLTGITWQWVRTITPVEVFVPTDPSHYTMALGDSGRIAVRADCNRGAGRYTLEGKRLTLGPLAITRMMCPPGSLDSRYLKELGAVASYFLLGDTLFVDLTVDSGTMRFVQARP